MRKDIMRAVDETLEGIACVLTAIRSELMAEDGGEWVNGRESIDWELRDLIREIERREE